MPRPVCPVCVSTRWTRCPGSSPPPRRRAHARGRAGRAGLRPGPTASVQRHDPHARLCAAEHRARAGSAGRRCRRRGGGRARRRGGRPAALGAAVERCVRAVLPVLCAFLVAVSVLALGRLHEDVGVLAPLVAPLVIFLPGALLTTAVIELSTGQMVSGAGRLASGLLQLVMLALGIVAGANLVGIPARSIDHRPPGRWATSPLGSVSPFSGPASWSTTAHARPRSDGSSSSCTSPTARRSSAVSSWVRSCRRSSALW